MRWMHLTPPDFRRAAQETGLAILPFGSIELHGDHLPLGCDSLIAETICLRAAEIEPAVVFPVWPFGETHGMGPFIGSVHFPPEMLIQMLRILLNEIAASGFEKILIYNGHGGNNGLLDYFGMATQAEPRNYALYTIKGHWSIFNEEEQAEWASVFTAPGGYHAGEGETSVLMDCAPGLARPEYLRYVEPVLPAGRFSHLGGITSGQWWYADYPENVTGSPSAASAEKGARLTAIQVQALARAIRTIKADTAVPAVRREFMERTERKLSGEQ